MQVFTEELTATGRLTAYVQDPSDELASAATRPRTSAGRTNRSPSRSATACAS